MWLIPLVLHSTPGQHRMHWLRKSGSVCTRFRTTFPPHKVKTKRKERDGAGSARPPPSMGLPASLPFSRLNSLAPCLPPPLAPSRCRRQHFLPAGPAALRFAPPRPGTAAACASPPRPAPLGVTLLPGRWRWAARLVCLGTGRWALGAQAGRWADRPGEEAGRDEEERRPEPGNGR